ncbi:MAG: hypothetical protein K2X82_08490 [Gemmataceae bacterium]|nr:hypothetical protein [Gemmataceae bacterium]
MTRRVLRCGDGCGTCTDCRLVRKHESRYGPLFGVTAADLGGPLPGGVTVTPKVTARPPCRYELDVLAECWQGEDRHARGCTRYGRVSRVPSTLAGRACSGCLDYTA